MNLTNEEKKALHFTCIYDADCLQEVPFWLESSLLRVRTVFFLLKLLGLRQDLIGLKQIIESYEKDGKIQENLLLDFSLIKDEIDSLVSLY